MKLTKDDLMKLSKERLVELLLETQDGTPNVMPTYPQYPTYPYNPIITTGETPCWAPGGWCSNPHHDCVNCPGKVNPFGTTWSTTTTQTTVDSTGESTEKKTLND